MSTHSRWQLIRDVPISAEIVDDTSIAGRKRLVSTLEAICRREHAAGVANDWTYNYARHARLLRTLTREKIALCVAIERERSEREIA